MTRLPARARRRPGPQSCPTAKQTAPGPGRPGTSLPQDRRGRAQRSPPDPPWADEPAVLLGLRASRSASRTGEKLAHGAATPLRSRRLSKRLDSRRLDGGPGAVRWGRARGAPGLAAGRPPPRPPRAAAPEAGSPTGPPLPSPASLAAVPDASERVVRSKRGSPSRGKRSVGRTSPGAKDGPGFGALCAAGWWGTPVGRLRSMNGTF